MLTDQTILENKKVEKYKIDGFLFNIFWKINSKKTEKFKIQNNLDYLSFLDVKKITSKRFPAQFSKIDCKLSVEKYYKSKKANLYILKVGFFLRTLLIKNCLF